MLTACGATHLGRIRKVNQDAFVCSPDEGVFVVGDGMGGHSAGEVASRLAVDTICTFLSRTRDGDKVTWPFGIDPTLSFDGNRVATALKLANRRVFKASEAREDYLGMGTTALVALVNEGRVVFASVGDSRIYSFTQGSLTQLTEDDSWVAMLLAQGSIALSAVPQHPMRNVLTNVVGARDDLQCRVQERELVPFETLLLATDGLHRTLDEPTIERVLAADRPPDAVVQALMEQALERAAADNITCVIIRYER